MKDNAITVRQCALIISLRCTLRCKLCLVYAPYYKATTDYPPAEVVKSVDTFFSLVDSVGTLNIQGGEPLMHKELPQIIQQVVAYKTHIGKILLTTNGTLLPSPELLEVLAANCDCIQVNISDYGSLLSRKSGKLIEILNANQIPYRVINYHGDNLHFGGWLDFTDHTLKHSTEEALVENAKECGYRQGGNLAIRLGELYMCYRVARRVELGIIPKDEKSFVDMYSDKCIEIKRQNINAILNAPYTPACAYCVGKSEQAVHHPAAVQLTPQELADGVERF